MLDVATDEPEVGQLVHVCGQQWVVTQLRRSRQLPDELAATRLPGSTLITLSSISDGDMGAELTVAWEVEPGREIMPATQLPPVTENGWDDPQRLGAFLDAVRWGTVASADTDTLQAPFRSGITIEEYQLEPVARALAMPRVTLLIADDVGLGKTIEAGLVAQELLLRHRARRVMVVCPAPLTIKWREEMARSGSDYLAWLQRWDGNRRKGSADLAARFVLRAERLLSSRGQLGFITTNTLVQGDTLAVGTTQVVERGMTIRRGRSSHPWPSSSANLEILDLWASKCLRSVPTLSWSVV